MAEPTTPRPQDIPDDLIRAATEGLMGLEVRRVIANVWPEIERQVREQVAAETLDDPAAATYDAAREQVDDEIGHEDGCDWYTTNGGYCSCKVWPAACAGASVAAERARGESR